MFLNLLDPDQQRLFVVAARMVAEQDGKVVDVEQSLLDAVIAECSIDEDPGPMPMPDLLVALDSALARPVRLTAVPSAKFSAPVLPGQRVRVELQVEVGAARFRLSRDGAELAAGRVEFADGAGDV